MIRRTAALALLVPLAALAVATPASAASVEDHGGGCYNVSSGGRQLLPNDLCYLGPEIPPAG